jgi:hypothetical protein
MSNASKTHQKFARFLHHDYDISKQDVLNYPQNYLGSNWEAVINFWLYLDTLSVNQLRVVNKHLLSLIDKERVITYSKVRIAAESTTEYAYDAGSAAFYGVSYENFATEYATLELIGLDKLLEQGHQPVFFPLFLNP